jgi:endonuclease YncB( thermonuclease family)
VGGYDSGYAAQEPAPAQRANPVMIEAGPDGEFTTVPQNPNPQIYEAQRTPAAAEEEPAAPEAPRYLLAFKDHTIYSAVAYWVDGDTLHYFTNGNTHNQVSLSLIDRPLTERLNREMGIDFSLPPAVKPAEK